jgi:indole-3-glycerol phosphate synthase
MILDDIVGARREDVARAKRRVPLSELEQRSAFAEARRGFAAHLWRADPAVIAEVKKASPSRGVIRADFDPVAIARGYAEGGAAAVSVLTEERYFQGSLRHLADIREAAPLPVLRKDFVFDPYQIVEARAWGADAVLLIAAVVEDDVLLSELLAAAAALQLDVLTEVHDEPELERAAAAGARIIGVNNRNLRTFVTTLSTAERLRPQLPEQALAVAESGIETAADISHLRACGYRAFLVGESLMRAPDPGARLRRVLEEVAAGGAR